MKTNDDIVREWDARNHQHIIQVCLVLGLDIDEIIADCLEEGLHELETIAELDKRGGIE